jgi:cell division protein FtsZ
MPEIKPDIETFAKIKVIGVGGAGGAAVNRMIQAGIKGVEFIVANTDVQALHTSKAGHKIHIGREVTKGLGAGMNPELGRRAAEESQNEIREALSGANMVFITCGLGGGTGTGAAPIVAGIARDLGALTIAVVTKPFDFEGSKRKTLADQGHGELVAKVDTIITIPNERLFQIIQKNTSLLDAFNTADEVLKQGVQGISEIITIPGLINVDFADVRTIMEGTGSALMGVGRASGENRAVNAAKAAIESPLLDITIDGAKGILFTITGGTDLSMQEINEAAKVISEQADSEAKIIFGANIDESLNDEVKITVIATGFNENKMENIYTRGREVFTKPTPAPVSFYTEKPKLIIQQQPVVQPRKEPESKLKGLFGGKINIDIETPINNRQNFETERAQNRERQNINDSLDQLIDIDDDLDTPTFIRNKMKGL